jgi:hypothetical protein
LGGGIRTAQGFRPSDIGSVLPPVYNLFARFEVLLALTLNITLFWDVTPCDLVDISYILVFCSEDEGMTLLRNIGEDLSEYTASYFRRL